MRNTILCGDAVNKLKEINSASVDLVVTDPPYLVNYRDRHNRTIANDTNEDGVLPVFDEVYRVMKNHSYCISFYGWNAVDKFSAKWSSLGFRIVGQFIFKKEYASKKGFAEYRHESAFLMAKGRPRMPQRPLEDVRPWEYTGNKSHPTEKAVSVIKPLIESFSKRGELVLDPFSGSGTTAVSAALARRDYLGVELEEKYCNIARSRLRGVERYIEKSKHKFYNKQAA